MKSYSQLNQDINVITFFSNLPDLYFIDLGAHDGKTISNTFLLETRGQDAAKQYVYDPIKMGDWVKLQILSAHQLMLECWSMPLDAKQEGENTILYGIKSTLLRNPFNKKQDKKTCAYLLAKRLQASMLRKYTPQHIWKFDASRF